MKEMEWSTLLIRMSNGAEEAFSEIYKCTKHDVYRLIYFLSPNKHEVEDIMSEVYLALYKNATAYKLDQPFQSWLNGIVVRQVRNSKRKGWRLFRVFEKLQLEWNEKQTVEDEPFTQLETEHYLNEQVNRLSQKFKEIIVLRYYQHYTFDEIARILSVPIGTIKSRHHYALKQLRKQYDRVENGKGTSEYVYGK